jgi:hypothetical protein
MKQKNFLHGIFLHEICGGSSSKAMAASSLSVREFKLRVFFSRKRQGELFHVCRKREINPPINHCKDIFGRNGRNIREAQTP